jgi:septal ring factor EnvC (AmiA/AmiB activator)
MPESTSKAWLILHSALAYFCAMRDGVLNRYSWLPAKRSPCCFSRTFRRSFCLLFLLLLLSAAIVNGQDNSTATAAEAGESEAAMQPTEKGNKPPPADVADQKEKVQRLQQSIKDHEEKIKTTQKKEEGLLVELEKIDHKLEIQEKKLEMIMESFNRQEKILADAQARLDAVVAEKEALQSYVQQRLTAYYQMGRIGLMNIVFSKKNLADLMSFQEYFNNMLQNDWLAIGSYQEKIAELSQARRQHEVEQKRLQDLVDKVESREEMLAAVQLEKKRLLIRVRTEEKLYQQAMAEIEDAAETLTASLERLLEERKMPPVIEAESTKIKTNAKLQPATPALLADTFPAQKGKLPLPVDGTIVRSDTQPIAASGIDIIVPKNREIRAVFNGTVIAAGYLRGYGNMIIIDHGLRYYTITSQAGEILKAEGNEVETGEVIGITGDSHTLLGAGLHFEIRRGSTPEDPMLWLDGAYVNPSK